MTSRSSARCAVNARSDPREGERATKQPRALASTRVTGGRQSLATVRQNQYSLPFVLAGLRVAARIGAREITFLHDGRWLIEAHATELKLATVKRRFGHLATGALREQQAPIA